MAQAKEMKYLTKKLKNAAEYIPGEQPQGLDEYIKLNTNENPFPPSKTVLDAIRAAANDTLKRYPDPTARKLREAFAAVRGLDPDNVFVGNGSDEIFTLIFRGFVDAGGAAAFAYPSYALYSTLAQMNGINYETVPLNKDFSYNLAGFLKKKYSLAIIANPNNPTGSYCEVGEIRAFLGKFKGLLVVDEAYIDFYGGSAAELVDEFDNIIVTQSMSKSYSLAGLRIGFAAAPADIIRGLMKIKDSYNVDSLATAGAIAALRDKRAFTYNIELVVSNKEYLEESLSALGFVIVPSRANFIFVKHPDVPALELYEKLKEMKILIRHYTGPVESDYIRISVGTMMEVKAIIKALSVITGA